MALQKTDFLEDSIVDHVTGVAAYTAPTNLFLALYSVIPTEAGGGTELTGNGYARQQIEFDASSGGIAINSNLEEFLAAGGAWLAIVGHALHDAISAGNMLYFDDGVSGPTLADTDKYSFDPGDISVQEQ